MFALGLLAVIQIVFLPGHLLLTLVRLDGGLRLHLVASFALSLVINHALVVILTLCGSFNATSLYVIFAVELGMAMWLLRQWHPPTIYGLLAGVHLRLKGLIASLECESDDKRGITKRILACLASAVTIGFTAYALSHIGQIFTTWDAVGSWNRWAIDWSNNRFPEKTWEYPQLVPSNWSLTYVFMQDSSVWFFAKTVMALFIVTLLLAIWDLYAKTRNFGYVLSAVTVPLILRIVLGSQALVSGYVDFPVAVLAFIAIYFLILARDCADSRQQLMLIIVGAVVASGAALTKQAGLYIAAVYPFLVFLLVCRSNQSVTRPVSWKNTLAKPALVTLLLVLLISPWYAYKQIEIRRGADSSNIADVTQSIHQGRNTVERVGFAVNVLKDRLNVSSVGITLLGIGMVLLLSFSLRDPVCRVLTPLLVLPFFAIWSVCFCYDERNLALALPFLGIATAMGLLQMYHVVERLCMRHGRSLFSFLPNLVNVPVTHCLVVLAIPGLLGLNSVISSEKLLDRQLALQRDVGVSSINQQLYEHQSRYGLEGVVLTDYQLMKWLPLLKEHYREGWSNSGVTWRKRFEDSQVRYALLHTRNTDPEVWSYLESEIAVGRCRVVFEDKFYNFYAKTELW